MIQDLHRVISLIEGGWGGGRVLVIGDIMLDRYIWGEVERISPEAPVPIVRISDQNERPGAAANVAMNIAGLGARTTLFGFCGDDADRLILEAALGAGGVNSQMTVVSGHPTTTKLRIISGRQQLLRVDRERTDGYPPQVYESLLAKVIDALHDAQSVVLSDYAKGVLSEDVCRHIIQSAREKRIPVLVDPKQRDFSRYRGATTICPNLKELAQATGKSQQHQDELLASGRDLVPLLGIEYLTTTLSERGIAVLREDSEFIAPAEARQVFDVSGAGDTVIATLALSVASGLQIETAVQLANLAAGIVVGKVGTVPITRNELLTGLGHEIELDAREKIITLDHLKIRAAAWRAAGERIVFTNGCFDLLHTGHITLIEDARRAGDRLVVGINSDTSVRHLKGPSRPIVGERERARVLAALNAVDAVTVFEDPTPILVIEALRPDVIVKGGDYSDETVVGGREVRSWGGTVKIVPIVEGFSTTRLIAKATTSPIDR